MPTDRRSTVTEPSHRMLVCALGYAPSPPGGAERQAQLQAEELARRGYEVHVVCPRTGSGLPKVISGVRVHRLPFIPWRPFTTASYCAALASFLAANLHRFDCVFVHHGYFQADVAVLLGRLLRTPIWVRIAASGPHAEIARMRRASRYTRYVGLRGASVVQAISADIERELSEVGVSAANVRLIPNGIDLSEYPQNDPADGLAWRQKLDLPREGVIVLYVGRLARHKGVEHLLRAWKSLSPQSTASLVLIGESTTGDAADLTDLPARVLHRPWTSDVAGYYKAVDAFVLPSLVEGMSNALLEAMACGLPVVATTVGAATAMVTDGESGLLVPPGDEPALASALGLLIGDEVARRRLGSAAALQVRAHYAIGTVVDEILSSLQLLATAA